MLGLLSLFYTLQGSLPKVKRILLCQLNNQIPRRDVQRPVSWVTLDCDDSGGWVITAAAVGKIQKAASLTPQPDELQTTVVVLANNPSSGLAAVDYIGLFKPIQESTKTTSCLTMILYLLIHPLKK